MLARLKIAAALAILDARAHIDDADWALAAHVAQRSHACRQAVAEAIATTNAATNRRRAEAEAERAAIVTVADHVFPQV